MNTTLKNTFLAIAVLSAAQAYAARTADAPVELPVYTIEDIAALPTPTHNPIPQVSKALVGANVSLKFTVNAQGRPESVRLARPLINYSDLDEMTFASQMRNLVAQWKFEPARNKAGDSISVKVIMPVRVVKKGSKISALASLILDTGSEDRS